MESIFRYPGGKSKSSIQRWIHSFRPSEMKEYREPFVGGGGVFFATSTLVKRWINDKHDGLIAVYKALAERPDDFIAMCKAIPAAIEGEPLAEPGERGGKRLNARLRQVFDSVRLNTECDQAFRYFFVNRTVFGGRVNYDLPSRLYFSNPDGWDIVNTDKLERAARRLKDVRITCGDYESLFTEPGEDVWVYADPPYVVNTNFTPTSQLYQHSFTDEDHKRLAAIVKACKHKVAMSYDDDAEQLVRALYPESEGFRIVRTEWKYCGSTNEKKTEGGELLVMNYEPHEMFASVANEVGMTEEKLCERQRYEAAIMKAMKAFIDMAENLRLIRDRRLYDDYGTFENYCLQKWNVSQRYVYQLFDSLSVVENLKNCTIAPFLPDRESQARELVAIKDESGNIDSETVATVWGKVVERAKKEGVAITAKLVKEEVQAAGYGKPPKEPDLLEQIERLWKKLTRDQQEEFISMVSQQEMANV